MSLWQNIARIGAGILAGPTGGMSLAAMPLIEGLGQVSAGVAGGRQQGRQAETELNQRQDALGQNRYRNELDAAQLNLGAPQVRANQSVRGDVLANAQPFKWTGNTQMVGRIPVPQSSGGLGPQLFSDNTRELGRMMSEGARHDQGMNEGRAIGAPPLITGMPQGNAGDSILSLIGQIAPFLSLIPQKKQQAPQQAQGGYVSNNVTPPRF